MHKNKTKILFLSSYPKVLEIHGEETVGVASYAKNLLTHCKNIKAEVLAEIFDKPVKYKEKENTINRIWKRNSIYSLFNLIFYITENSTKRIVVNLEYYMLGGFLQNLILLIGLIIWRLKGKKIIIILHQVITELFFIYYPLLILADRVIVFEEKFKKALKFKNVIFIPHAVEEWSIKKVSKKTKKEKFTVLFFGFISPYKGIKELAKLWDDKYGKLIIAGGINPNHKKNKKYIEYAKGLDYLGIIPENKIPEYFIKADLVIFPYKKFFSSSGPLSLALSFEKPFILSKALEGYFESPDFKEALEEVGLKKEDFLFDLTKESLEKRLNRAKKNLKKLAEFSRIMKEKRAWSKAAEKYEKVIQET